VWCSGPASGQRHRSACDFGGYFVVMRYSGMDNGRPVSQIDLFGWDADSKHAVGDGGDRPGEARPVGQGPNRWRTPGGSV